MEVQDKAARLRDRLRAYGSLLVAYSGGTDSAYLAWEAHQVLGDEALAVIADSPSLPRKELQDALRFAEVHGIPVRVIQTAEMEDPAYVRNAGDRCFFCKDELFSSMRKVREQLGFQNVAFGMNVDDRGEYRPGQEAAWQHGVLAPLVEAELSKAEIRQLAAAAGLTLHDKPASACLSSRIAYGLEVTHERLRQVEEAEIVLHSLGFARVRVRHHDVLARVEVAREDMPRILETGLLDTVSKALQGLGFRFVALDMEGYRTGSMNDLLPASAIARASHA